MLKSVLIVILAGIATVLLAIAVRAGLEAAGIDIVGWRQTLISGLSAVVVVYLFAWQIRKNSPVPVGRIRGSAMVVPLVIYLAVMIFLIPWLQLDDWPWNLTMFSLMAAAVVSSHLWEAHKAISAAERAE